MELRKEKIKINATRIQFSDDDNQFLDDFLKPPPKTKKQPTKNTSNIKVQHYSVPAKLNKNKSAKLQSIQQANANQHIKQILKNIKKEQQLRREKTLKLLKQVAEQKQQQKKMHEFRIAQRRIKKRLMLIQRKQRLQEQLLSFVHNNKFEEQTFPDKVTKEKSKSVDDLTEATAQPIRHEKNGKKLIKIQDNGQKYVNTSQTSAIRQKRQQKQSQAHLPQIKNASALFKKKHIERVSTITLTKVLKIERQQVQSPKSKRKNYFSELRRRNYTEANQLTKILHDGQASLQKTQRAVELANKLQNSRRLKLKNINEVDYKQAQRKIELLNFIHKAHDK